MGTLTISNSTATRTYPLANWVPDPPYLEVDNSYLPLTTQMHTGLQMKVKGKHNTYEAIEMKKSVLNMQEQRSFHYCESAEGVTAVGQTIHEFASTESYRTTILTADVYRSETRTVVEYDFHETIALLWGNEITGSVTQSRYVTQNDTTSSSSTSAFTITDDFYNNIWYFSQGVQWSTTLQTSTSTEITEQMQTQTMETMYATMTRMTNVTLQVTNSYTSTESPRGNVSAKLTTHQINTARGILTNAYQHTSILLTVSTLAAFSESLYYLYTFNREQT